MVRNFFSRRKNNAAVVDALYGRIVSQARRPAYYGAYGAADSVLGRFEVLALQMFLVLRRMRSGGAGLAAMAQDLTDRFFQDLDHSIRELGVGDRGVPRRMKTLAAMFYGRTRAYGEALDAQAPAALAEALRRNYYSQGGDSSRAAALSGHVIACARRLDRQQDGALLHADLHFADPAAGAAEPPELQPGGSEA